MFDCRTFRERVESPRRGTPARRSFLDPNKQSIVADAYPQWQCAARSPLLQVSSFQGFSGPGEGRSGKLAYAGCGFEASIVASLGLQKSPYQFGKRHAHILRGQVQVAAIGTLHLKLHATRRWPCRGAHFNEVHRRFNLCRQRCAKRMCLASFFSDHSYTERDAWRPAKGGACGKGLRLDPKGRRECALLTWRGTGASGQSVRQAARVRGHETWNVFDS